MPISKCTKPCRHPIDGGNIFKPESRISIVSRLYRLTMKSINTITADTQIFQLDCKKLATAVMSRLLISTQRNDDWIYRDELARSQTTTETRSLLTTFIRSLHPRGMTTGAPPQTATPAALGSRHHAPFPLRACRYVVMVTTATPSYLLEMLAALPRRASGKGFFYLSAVEF
jgi:hypothetical protein